jgi:hypothetical protein
MSDDDTALIAWTDHSMPRYALRPLGGGFGGTQQLFTIANDANRIHAAFASDGAARLLWEGGSNGAGQPWVMTTRITPDGGNDGWHALQAPQSLPQELVRLAGLGVHESGEAVIAWAHHHDADPGPSVDTRRRIRTAILDLTPPVISALEVSGLPLAGNPLTMKVSTSDALSGSTATWDFGDGTTEEGETLTKTYPSPGVYTVRVTVTDDAGNVTTRDRVVTVRQPG